MNRIKIICGVLLAIALGLMLAHTLRPNAPSHSQAVNRPALAAAPAGTSTTAITTAAPATATVQAPLGQLPPRPNFLPAEKLLATATTLALRELPDHQPGRHQRQRLVKAEFKYPLLRVVETVHRDVKTGAETIQHREVAVADHVMVRVSPQISATDLTALATRLGGDVRKKMYSPHMFLVSFSGPTLDTLPDRMRELLQIPGIELAEPDYINSVSDTTPNDTNFGLLWGLQNTGQTNSGQVGIVGADIDAPAAWDITTGDTNIVVGVIDSGVDYNHPDLAANAWVNPGEIAGNGIDDDANGFVDDIYGRDFYNDDSNPMDDNSHGTHCAGTIGGVGDNNLGVVGVCWRVKIMGLKFLSASGSGSSSDAVDAIYYATQMRVRLTSNSWGGGGYLQSLSDAIATAGQANILFVAAAGNSTSNNDSSPHYPSSYTNANIISVAATDNRDQIASFSSYGLTSVDIGAPGVSTYSTTPNNGYGYKSGTSMATPHVSGACALAFARKPDATWTEIKQAIFNGADPIAALSGKCVTGARLNIFDTLQLLDVNVSLSPLAAMVFTGPDGGPFTPATNTYVIANIGTNTFDWTATKNNANWFDLSLTSGTLAPGQSNIVVVTWKNPAPSYAPGTYTGTIQFANTLNAAPAVRNVTLQVLDSLSVTPATGFTAIGPDGGPFSPNSQGYVISNRASTVRSWAGSSSANWLTVPAGGVLPANTATNVTVALNANAAALPAGRYAANATFANLTTGSTQSYAVSLRAGVDDFTELFSANDNDLDNRSWTFTPNGSGMFYAACRNVITTFPTDPAGGTTVSLTDDSFVNVALTAGKSVALYGTTYTNLFISSNGYLTFGTGDSAYDESVTAHFNRPRIAALFDDLNPATGGTISRQQLGDRLVVTYQNIRQYNVADTNSFQIELFFNGTIRLSYLAIAASDGLVGLSTGSGAPVAFEDSDFSSYDLCPPPADLALSLAGAPNPVGIGSNLTYTISMTNLGSGAASAVTVTNILPASVTFVSASPGCTYSAGKVICDLGTLTGGAQSNINIYVTPTLRAIITNTASVTSATVEFVSTNNAAMVLTSVTGPPSTNADLANLVFSAGALSPVFASNIFSYAATVPYSAGNLTVTGIAADLYATLTVNGNALTSGIPSAPISLSVGANVITTKVVSESLTATNTYTVTVTRDAGSSNALLASLVPSAGSLLPVFDSNTFSYTQSFTFATGSLTLTPTAAFSNANINVNGSTVVSGTPSASIPLNVGTNVINTMVVAENLTATNTYELTVIRAASIARWWDGGTTDIITNGNGVSAGGSGIWNTTIQNWDQGNGTPHGPWDNANGNIAVFGGAAGTVTNTVDITVGGLIFTNAYTLTNASGASLAFSAAGTISNSAAVTMTSPLTGTGPITKTGTGTLTLSASNSYSGGTVINAGTLATTADSHLGTSGGITVNGAAIWNAGINVVATYNRALTINEGAVLSLASGNAGKTNSGVLSGNGSIVNTATTVFYFPNTNNTFTGTVNNGYETQFGSLGDSSNPINLIGSNSRFTWIGGAKTFALRPFTIQAAGTGVIDNSGSGALSIQQPLAITGTAGTRTLSLGGSYSGSANAFSGNITDSTSPASVVSLTKSGTGNWYLSGINTYSGATTLTPGNPSPRLTFQGIQALSPNTSIQVSDSSSSTTLLQILDDGVGTISRTTVPITFTPSQTSAPGTTHFFVGNNNTANGGTSASTQTDSIIALGGLTMQPAQTGNNGATINITGANNYKLQLASIAFPDLSGKSVGLTYTVKLVPTSARLIVAGGVTPFASANLNSTPVLNLDGTATTNEIQGAIVDPSNVGTSRPLTLAKTSSSIWTLSGANTYSGGTTVSGGTLNANSVYALGRGNVTVSGATSLLVLGATGAITNTARLYLPSATTTNLTMNANNAVSALYLNGVLMTNGVYSAAINAGAWMNGSGTLTVGPVPVFWDKDGATSGAGGATPTGTWGLDSFWSVSADGDAGTAAWTAGRTAVFAAGTDATGDYTVTVDGTQDLGGMTFEEGTVTLSGGTALRMVIDSQVYVTATNQTATVATAITQDAAPRSLIKGGPGTLVLSGANTYTGPTDIAKGRLKAGVASVPGTSGAFGNTTVVTLDNNATAVLDLNGYDNTIASLSGGGASGGNVVLGTATLTTGGNNASTTYAGVISGGGGLTKSGSGTQTLTGTNAYTGNTAISGGKLQIGINGTANGARLGGVSGSYAGNITNNGTLDIQTDANMNLSGVISGSGSLLKRYIGTLTLSGSNTYLGKTTINALANSGSPTLVVSSFNSVNGGTPLLTSSSLGAPTTVANGTIEMGSANSSPNPTLRYTGAGETTDRVIHFIFNSGAIRTLDASGTGPLKFTSPFTATGQASGGVTLTGTGMGEIGGGITNIGSGALTKSGTGTWTLSGSNIYTCPTTVSAGTLLINGNSAALTNVVTVATNATFGGMNTIGGIVRYQKGSRALFTVTPDGSGYNNSNYMTFTNAAFLTNVTVRVNLPAALGNGVYVLATNYVGFTTNGTLTFATNSGSLGAGGSGVVSVDGNNLVLTVSGVGGGGSSTNAFLNSLVITPTGTLSPSFASNVFTYTATNAFGVSPTVTVVNADLTATNQLIYSGATNGLASGSPSSGLSLTLGVVNPVMVRVTAQDNVTVQTYTVNVTMQPSLTSPSLGRTVSGTTLSLSWPASHLGYTLQQQTNSRSIGLSTNWAAVPGSTSVTSTNVTIDPTKPTTFYRLVYP